MDIYDDEDMRITVDGEESDYVGRNEPMKQQRVVEVQDDFTKLLNRARSGIRTGIHLLYSANHNLRADREFVINEVQRSGKNLEFASDELKDDKEVVMHSVSSMGTSIEWASERLQNDKEVVMIAVANHPTTLNYVADKYKDDIEVMMEATTTGGWALEFASDRLKDDKDFVFHAVTKERGGAVHLQHASERLREDKHFILEVAKILPDAGKYAGPVLKEQIGNNEPVSYLTRAIFAERLQNTIPRKDAVKEKGRGKI